MSEKLKAKRILIFNVNWLGDVLFSSATIRNVRRNYPDSYIACVIASRCFIPNEYCLYLSLARSRRLTRSKTSLILEGGMSPIAVENNSRLPHPDK